MVKHGDVLVSENKCINIRLQHLARKKMILKFAFVKVMMSGRVWSAKLEINQRYFLCLSGHSQIQNKSKHLLCCCFSDPTWLQTQEIGFNI